MNNVTLVRKEPPESLFREDGLRLDGRGLDGLRPIRMEVGVLNNADGSAYVEHGKNKIVAAVYGPRELHPKHLALPDKALVRCEYRMATFSVEERKSPAPGRREVELSKVIRESLEPAIFVYKYPRATIDIFVQILQADGGTRCASITAAALALADAGVPMRDLVVGCAVGKIEGKVAVDLSDVEDKLGEGDIPMALMPTKKVITLLQSDGDFTPEEFKQALEMGITACEKIYEMQRDVLIERYSKVREEVAEEQEEE